MTVDPRDHVVGSVLSDIVDAMHRSKTIHKPTEHEEQMINGLIVAALGPPMVDARELNFRQFEMIATKGRAARRILDEFPAWQSHPDKPLGDWLKIANDDATDRIVAQLHRLSGLT